METVVNNTIKKIIYLVTFTLLITGCSSSDDSVVIIDDGSDSNLVLPIITLTDFEDITFFSANSGGQIVNDGNLNILSKGLCWSLIPNPDINDYSTNNGSGSDNFTSEMSGLDVGINYYVRAYITISSGIIYSEEEQFTTLGKIFSGGISLETQEELEIFGANNYTHFYGNLRILDDITDLTPLSSLVLVDGQLVIGNSYVTSLSGLNNINLVKDLIIRGNDLLQNIDDLEGLTEITRDLSVHSNFSILDLEGLHNVEAIGRGISLSSNISMVSLTGLENLNQVNGDLIIISNPIENIDALNNIESINGYLTFSHNDSLLSINGFQNLTTVNGSIIIQQNILLTNIDGFSNLSSVAGNFTLLNNYELIDFCGIQPLLVNDGLLNNLYISQNAYNPTYEDIVNGNCSL